MSSNKEKETSSSSTESDLDFDISGYKMKKSECIMHLSSSSDEVNVTVNSQSQLSVDMPGPSNKRMESRFRKSATQELDTEYFNTDSENANLSSSSDQGNVTVDSESECQSQISVDMPGPSNTPMETSLECTQDIGNESQYIFIPLHNKNIHLPPPSCKPLAKPTSCELNQHEDDGDDEFDSETTANSSSDTVIVSDTQNETERFSQYVDGEPTQSQSQEIFPQTLSQASQNLERHDRRKSHVNYLHSSDVSSSSTDQDFVPVESETPTLIRRQNAMYIHKEVVPPTINVESTDSEDEFLPPSQKEKKIAYCTDQIM